LGIIHVLREPAQNENGFFSLGWGVVSKKVVRIFWLFSVASQYAIIKNYMQGTRKKFTDFMQLSFKTLR
jgi:hypothetical protein